MTPIAFNAKSDERPGIFLKFISVRCIQNELNGISKGIGTKQTGVASDGNYDIKSSR